ncbi:MAG: hydrogenase maturation protease [Peptococcaceae bacterium]|nr:hydrogenase maturation protease [Peptococcaceae bacterium]
MNKQITILGLGNPLLKDDGIGLRVIEELHKAGLPNGIHAAAAGGSFYHLWDIMSESKQVIVVDALQAGGLPGTVYLLRPDEIVWEEESAIFRHEDDFFGVLDFMSYYGIRPEVIIVGIEPKEITYSLDLSPEIEMIMPMIINIVRKLILSFSVSFK